MTLAPSGKKGTLTTVELKFPQPPFELNNLVALSYDTKKLSHFLDYLNENDTKFNDDIAEINDKVTYLEVVKEKLKELYNQQDLLQGKLFETLKITNQNNLKISEMGQQLRNHEDRIHNQENENKALKKKSIEQEASIKTLFTFQTEDRASIEKLNGEVLRIFKTLEDHETKMKNTDKFTEELDKRLKAHGSRIDSLEVHIEKIYEESKKIKNLEESVYVLREVTEKRIEDMKRLFNDHVNTSLLKFTELSNTIEKIFLKMNDLGDNLLKVTQSGGLGSGMSTMGAGMNQTIITSVPGEGKGLTTEMLEQWDQMRKDNAIFKKKNNEYDKATSELDEKIKKLRSVLIDVQANQQTKEDIRKQEEERTIEKQEREKLNDFLHKTVFELKEMTKQVETSLSIKINKDDLDESNRNTNKEIEKINQKILENMKLTDSKLQMFMRSGIGKALMGELFHSENAHLKDEFTQEINKIILANMKANQNLKNFFKTSELHGEGLRTLNDKLEIIIKEREEEKEINQKLVDDSTKRLYELEFNNDILKKGIEDLVKKVDGDDQQSSNQAGNDNKGENVLQTQATSMKDMVKGVIQTLKFANERIEKLSARQDSFGTETLNKLKKDLMYESSKVFDEFRHDLKYSLERIQDQLREKVDRFNLEDLGKRFDLKITDEVAKKIDKNDLAKNTSLITRKINNLEGKINKTLVETLIDLQVEDMPLITRKTAAGEKCASCNQVLQPNKGGQSINASASVDNLNFQTQHIHGPETVRKNKFQQNMGRLGDNPEGSREKNLKERTSKAKDYGSSAVGDLILPDINDGKKAPNEKQSKKVFTNKGSTSNLLYQSQNEPNANSKAVGGGRNQSNVNNLNTDLKSINYGVNPADSSERDTINVNPDSLINKDTSNPEFSTIEQPQNKLTSKKLQSDNVSEDMKEESEEGVEQVEEKASDENFDEETNKKLVTREVQRSNVMNMDLITPNSEANTNNEIKSNNNKLTLKGAEAAQNNTKVVKPSEISRDEAIPQQATSAEKKSSVTTTSKTTTYQAKVSSTQTTKISSKTQTKTIKEEETYTAAIKEELEKTNVNPEKLIRAANKLFDGLEKKYK